VDKKFGGAMYDFHVEDALNFAFGGVMAMVGSVVCIKLE
jgi:hypothetical protein